MMGVDVDEPGHHGESVGVEDASRMTALARDGSAITLCGDEHP